VKAFVSRIAPHRAAIEHGVLLVLIGLGGAASFGGSSLQNVLASPLRFMMFVALLAGISACFIALTQARHAAAQRKRPLSQDALMALIIALCFIAVTEGVFQVGHSRAEAVLALAYNWAAILIASMLAMRKREASRRPVEPLPPPLQPSVIDHAAGIQFIEAEDHYVKLVYGDRVEHKRARFGEVIAGFSQLGLQVHKSFWVRRASVKGTRRQGRRLMHILEDGTEIPVGRSNERKVLESFG
jgi:hypothetical protein